MEIPSHGLWSLIHGMGVLEANRATLWRHYLRNCNMAGRVARIGPRVA
jgi:hypothetical protein